MLVLTLDKSKSPVVGGIMVIPMLWLVLWYCLNQDARVNLPVRLIRFYKKSVAIILILGVVSMAHAFMHTYSKRQLRDLPVITQMYLDIGNYIATNNIPLTHVSSDHVSDYLTAGGIATVYYETKGKLLKIAPTKLGGRIFSTDEKEVLDTLQITDILIVNLGSYDEPFLYPFNQSMLSLKSGLMQYAEKHFRVLGEYHFYESNYRVYVARS